MKLILQIALGVFLGTLASQLCINGWQAYQDGISKKATENLRTEQEKVRLKQGERIRALLLQGRQDNTSNANKPPADFVPDDASSGGSQKNR